MNEEILFKWDRESVGKYIWKSEYVKAKCHCLFSKQYKNLSNLLKVLREIMSCKLLLDIIMRQYFGSF